MVETAILTLVTVGTILMMVIEGFAVWRERPPVVWNEYHGRWMAKRGYKGRAIPRIHEDHRSR